MDRRLTPANGRVAHVSLRGQVAAGRLVEGEAARIARPLADLRAAPGGRRDRQMLFGAEITVLEKLDGWAFVQRALDGYVGYVEETALAAPRTPSHVVATPATHLYAAEDFKSPDLMHLSLGARVQVVAERRRFWETPDGYIPKTHLRPLDRPYGDPAAVAQMLFGVPYLWGGNSTLGIDCSGLVQAALTACAIACPGDSDLQCAGLGRLLDPAEKARRADLWFWKGHVAMAVDDQTLIHANAHHMAVAYEPIAHAEIRIAAQGDGPVLARRRIEGL